MTGWPLTTVLWELEGEAQRGGPEPGAASPSQVQGDQPELVLTTEGGRCWLSRGARIVLCGGSEGKVVPRLIGVLEGL